MILKSLLDVKKMRGLTFLDFANWLLKTTVHIRVALREM